MNVSGGLFWILEEEVVAVQLLLLVELRLVLVDTRAVVDGVASEGDVQVLEEGVATRQERLWRVGVRLDTRLAVEDDDTVGEVSSHDEIVLDDKRGLLGVHDEALDDASGNDTLLRVKVGRRLVDKVDIGGQTKGQDNSHTLQLTTRQMLDFLVDEVLPVF